MNISTRLADLSRKLALTAQGVKRIISIIGQERFQLVFSVEAVLAWHYLLGSREKEDGEEEEDECPKLDMKFTHSPYIQPSPHPIVQGHLGLVTCPTYHKDNHQMDC